MSRNRITSEDALLINQIATGIKNGDDVRDMLSQITDMTESKRDRVLKSLGDELNRLDVTQRRLKLESKTPGEKFFVDMPTKGPMRELQALKRTSAVQLRKDPESGKIEMVPSGTLMVEPEGKIGMYSPGIQPGTEMSEVEGAIAELKARGEYKPIYDTQPMLLAAAINDMYEGPDLPYEQQVSQAVRSAGLPRATMPGMRPVSLMERNLELERTGDRVQRNSDFYRKENPMLGPPDPTPMQMRKMAVPMIGPQMDSPYEGNPSESGPQSATLAELRSQKAYDRGFRRFLQDREQYQSSQRPSIAEEEEFFKGGSMLAESARQRAIKDRDTASIEALGFAEGQEFAERETQSTVDRALRGGLRMEPTREDIAFMESVEETPPEML
tara:strand:- start:1421 stop:2575 length:1155 start_codon:yes stop_codon:yes gene_type:complete